MGGRGLVVLVVLLMACQGSHFTPETPVPSDARIRELARRDRTVIKPELPFRVTVTPAFILAGGAVWVTCFVPRSVTAYSVEWGIPGLSMSSEDVSRMEYKRMIERVPCGQWVAVCQLSDGQHREAKVEARGHCNAEDPGDR